MKQRLFVIGAIVAAAALLCAARPAAQAQSLLKDTSDLRVMTYNLNEGTDYIEVRQAQTPLQFLIAVGQTITQVRATDPAVRMQAVAKQIIEAAPALISLQEIDQWATGPYDPINNVCGPVQVEYNMLPELMKALRQQGGHYRIAVSSKNWSFSPVPGLIPPATFFCVQVIDRIAILARTDLDPSVFHVSNPQKHRYENNLQYQTAVGVFPFVRSWASVDAMFQGEPFRFIATHLDSIDPNINELQGTELRVGPANTSLPVMVAMDANSQAFPMPQGATYLDFMNAGYGDVWSELFPDDPGLTCCQAQLDNNVESQLSQRIDLILTNGPIEAQNAALFGVTQASKTAGGLWPSDHAGVAAQVVLKPAH